MKTLKSFGIKDPLEVESALYWVAEFRKIMDTKLAAKIKLAQFAAFCEREDQAYRERVQISNEQAIEDRKMIRRECDTMIRKIYLNLNKKRHEECLNEDAKDDWTTLC